MRKINQEGVELIKKYEGFREEAYLCPADVWTVGYGTTRLNGVAVKRGDRLTEQGAEKELYSQLEHYEDGVEEMVRVPINDCQFSSLVSFAYNLGLGALQGSTLLRKLNRGNYEGASKEFRKWVYANGKKLNGLVKRREDERKLFVKEDC